MHNNLLHGANVKFINTGVVNRVDHHGELEAPSPREVRVQEGQGQGVAFWDAESNVHLMRKKFAVEVATATREVEPEGAAAAVAPAGESASAEEAAEVEAAPADTPGW